MQSKWKRPYKCRICGCTRFLVHGGHRRCAVCWPRYRSDWGKKNRGTLADQAKEYRRRRKKKYTRQRQGMSTAYPMDSRRPEVDRRHRDKRTAAIKNGIVTREELLAIVKRDGGRCVFCGVEVVTRCTPASPRGFDHLFPLLGDVGEHEAWNMAVCCLDCNSMKGQRTFLEYIEDEDMPYTNFSQIPNVHFGLDEEVVLDEEWIDSAVTVSSCAHDL